MDINELKYNIRYGYSVAIIVILVFVILFILMTLAGGSTNSAVLLKFGANNSVLVIAEKEYFRLITSAFLHIGIFHLIFNSFAFLYIAKFVEDNYGALKMFAVFIFTALIASIFSIITAIFTNSILISAGASGGIFGLTGLLLGNTFRKNTYNYDLGLDRTRLLMFIGLNLVIGFSIPGIDNSAHIGGLISGFILGLILNPKSNFSNSKYIPIIEKGFGILMIILTILAFIGLLLTNFI